MRHPCVSSEQIPKYLTENFGFSINLFSPAYPIHGSNFDFQIQNLELIPLKHQMPSGILGGVMFFMPIRGLKQVNKAKFSSILFIYSSPSFIAGVTL